MPEVRADLQAIIHQYQAHIDARNWPEALHHLTTLIQVYPGNLQLHERLGQLYLKLDSPEAALKELQWVAREYARRGDKEKALSIQKDFHKLSSKTKEHFSPVRADHPPPSSVPTSPTKPVSLNPYLSPILCNLEKEERTRLLTCVKIHNLPPGQTVFKQGDRGYSVYIVARGKLQVTLEDRHQQPIPLFTLREGEHFGEIAYLIDCPREVTVTTMQETQLWEIEKEHFHALLQKHPKLIRRIEGIYQVRLEDMLEKMKKMGTDRRRNPRVAITLPITLMVAGGEGEESVAIPGVTRDISISGIQTVFAPPPSLRLVEWKDLTGRLFFSLSLESSARHSIGVKVVRVLSQEDALVVGMKFTETKEEVKSMLNKLVAQQLISLKKE